MTKHVKTLFEEARRLKPRERRELAEMLLETVGPLSQIEADWAKELDRRWQEHLQSGEKTLDAFEMLDEVRQDLTRSRTKKPAKSKKA